MNMKNLLLKIKFKLHVKCFNSTKKFANYYQCDFDFSLIGIQYIIDNKPVYYIYGCRTDFQVSFIELMQYMTSKLYMNY